jgi:hypothetical protein
MAKLRKAMPQKDRIGPPQAGSKAGWVAWRLIQPAGVADLVLPWPSESRASFVAFSACSLVRCGHAQPMKHEAFSEQIGFASHRHCAMKCTPPFFVQFVARAPFLPGRNLKATSHKESGPRLRRPRFVSGNAKHVPNPVCPDGFGPQFTHCG